MSAISTYRRPAASVLANHGGRAAILDAITELDAARLAERARKRPRHDRSRRIRAAEAAMFNAIVSRHGTAPERIPLPSPEGSDDLDGGEHHGAVRHEGRILVATHRCDFVVDEERYRWGRAVVVLRESHVVDLIPVRHRAAAAAVALYEAGGSRGVEALQAEVVDAMPEGLVPHDYYADEDFAAAVRHRGRLYVYTSAGDETEWGERFIIELDGSDIVDV